MLAVDALLPDDTAARQQRVLPLELRIVAVCRRGRNLLRVALLELPMPDPRPRGAEWVDAYRHWAEPR